MANIKQIGALPKPIRGKIRNAMQSFPVRIALYIEESDLCLSVVSKQPIGDATFAVFSEGITSMMEKLTKNNNAANINIAKMENASDNYV